MKKNIPNLKHQQLLGENGMSISESTDVEKTLAKPDIHNQWRNSYRTAENERFYDKAFDYILNFINPPENSVVLDAGCGSCNHSIRLAKRGLSVIGMDFAESALRMAALNLQSSAWQHKIKLEPGNILSLTFSDETFEYILCWGVLMHIPDIEKAISELTRVLKRGGILIISEGNMVSIQSVILRNIKLLLGKEKAVVRETPAGLEYWTITSNGKLLTRHANIQWLKKKFRSSGFTVKNHFSGQFTELYTVFSSRKLQNVIHTFNYVWFKYIKLPYFAFGNILILQKRM